MNARTLIPICLLATGLVAFAQTAPPTAPVPPPPDLWEQTPAPPARAPIAPMPPAPPVPPVESMDAMPPMEPLAPMPPLPPIDIDLGDLDLHISIDTDVFNQDKFNQDVFNQDLRDQIEAAKEQAGRVMYDFQDKAFFKEQMLAARDMARTAMAPFAFLQSADNGTPHPNPMPSPKVMAVRSMSDDRLYTAGQGALDSRHWDQALDYFTQAVSRGGSRVDGALYWKAYALGKLGRRDEAAATIAELRKSYAGSRWQDDARALELELKQASGQKVSPEAESDDELKLMAINGLMQSDPERAIPLLESQLKGSASPKVKRNTLFVLAQSNSPKAQALIEQIARGGANPDLQLKAISYMDQRRRPNNAQVLSEIYGATTDLAVKRAILQAYAGMRDKDRLLQAAKTEKSPELREFAIGALAGNNGTPELWQLYQAETTTEGKLQLLRYMYSNSNADKLLEVVRTEKDPKVRADAMRVLASQRTGINTDTMVSLYNAEQDPQIKLSILDGLCQQRNAKAMVDIARAEKDTRMKLRIVERLSSMKSKEASDYLEEILKK